MRSKGLSVPLLHPSALPPTHPCATADGVDLSALLATRKVVVFGVPGAFTAGCSKTHLPQYVHDAAAYRAKGVDEIICVSVNDPFVMAAWGEAQGAAGKVRMLADTNGELTKALGLEINLPGLGGIRSKRYSAIVDKGVVTTLNVEPESAATGLTCSLSGALLPTLA